MQHAMIDLETLGVGDNAVILSIGAVQFSLHSQQIGSEIKLRLDPNNAVQLGMQIEADTIKWWLQQNAVAREDLFKEPGVPVVCALTSLSHWLEENNIRYVWGNSVRFDFSKLVHAYNLCGIAVPWNTKDCERDFKTYNWQFPGYLQGSAHEPIADCFLQLRRLFQITGMLRDNGIILND